MTMHAQRYRLKLATWMVVREGEQPSPRIFHNPEDAGRFAQMLARAQDDDKEHFWVALLNIKHRYLMHTEVSTGSQTASLVHPREVFGPAVREGAATVLLVHNHPSGEPTPSPEDRELTRRLVECGKLLGIEVLDHVIVGNGTGRWTSFRGRGELSAERG
jgi:DNA repair protein RadC